MAYTQAQLDALIAIRASGQLRVTFGDRTIQYQSGAELDAAIEQAKRDLSATTRLKTTRRYPQHDRGY